MDDSLWLILLFQAILIALNAIFASAEIAVLGISDAKLEKMADDGNRRAKRLFKLTREPAKFLATIQVAITLSGFLGSAFAADNFSEPLVEWLISLGVNIPRQTLDAISVVVITLILSYITLVFGELVPKRIAMKKSESIALGISGLVSGIAVIFRPIVALLSVSTNLVLRLIGIDPNPDEEEVTEEEIRMMVDAGSEKGTIEDTEREIIQNVFEFNDTVASEIAIHRTDVVLLLTDDTDEEWHKTIFESAHTLFPVCDGSPDNVIGILNSKLYFRLADKSRGSVMENCVSPAYFVPETIKADVLFRDLKKNTNKIAVVMDEYGGMVGIVTMNDILEVLVGELSDETDPENSDDPYTEYLEDGIWQIFGNIDLAELQEDTGIEFSTEEYDTLSGLVFDKLGRIPDDGNEVIEMELENAIIIISKVEQHQVVLATIAAKSSIEETPEENEE